MMEKTLIIEVFNSGLGDHLFHSHLPRIAKENNGYTKVLISNKSAAKTSEYLKLVWSYNPFVDGFTDQSGIICNIADVVSKVNPTSKNNLLDEVMLHYGLENNKRWNNPEIFYAPKIIEAHKLSVFDPNFLSWIGNVTNDDAMIYFRKKGLSFDAVMKKRSEKFFFKPTKETKFIETPTLEDFCDLIHSCKTFYCLTSGAATLANALGKNAIVFYGAEQEVGYQHNSNHEYYLVPRYLISRVKRKLKIK